MVRSQASERVVLELQAVAGAQPFGTLCRRKIGESLHTDGLYPRHSVLTPIFIPAPALEGKIAGSHFFDRELGNR